jgi:hypothetical protein
VHGFRAIHFGPVPFGTIGVRRIHIVPKLLRLTHTRCPFPITI